MTAPQSFECVPALHLSLTPSWFGIMVYSMMVMSSSILNAQTRTRDHIVLPRTEGATVLSTYINATANRIAAEGDFLESAAAARKINLQSDRIEMENYTLWMKNYFERRKLNYQYRRLSTSNRLDRERAIARGYHQRILNGRMLPDPASELNFMLSQLICNENALAAILVADKPIINLKQEPFTPNELLDIQLKSQGGLEFSLSSPRLIQATLPNPLLEANFAEARAGYERARQRVIREISAGRVSYDAYAQMNTMIIKFQAEFDDAYAATERNEFNQVELKIPIEARNVVERFFQSQLAGIKRAYAIDDPSAFENQIQFDGEYLTDIIKYCSSHHLSFSSPKHPNSAAYAKLYTSLKKLYLEFLPSGSDF